VKGNRGYFEAKAHQQQSSTSPDQKIWTGFAEGDAFDYLL